MFIDHQRAARIEAAEGKLCAAVAAAVPGHAVTAIGGGVSVFARPGSPVNKVVGLGFGQVPGEDELAALEAKGEVRVELSTLADPAVGAMLTRRGYVLEHFENVLGIELPALARSSAVEVEPAADTDAWLAVAVDGAAQPDETSGQAENYPRELIEEVMVDFVRAAGFRRYVARLDGQIAASASMRVEDDLAMFTGAATLPRFRRRGAQGALLAHRLAEAEAAGCAIACITTAPGTRSQENSQRHGFSLLYARAILVRH